jgi:hypothetical protein
MQLAQKRAQLSSIDRQEISKSTQDSYDKLNESNSTYDKQEYQGSLDVSTSVNELSSADAQISRSANLNRMLLQSIGENYEN